MPATAADPTKELCERAERACAAARQTAEDAKDIVAIAVAYIAAWRLRMDVDREGPI